MEIQRPEGIYGFTCGHFYIQCKCGSGKGCHYKSLIPKDKDQFNETDYKIGSKVRSDVEFYSESNAQDKKIFYTNIKAIESLIGGAEDSKMLPLTLICNNCNTEFDLTPKLFEEVVGRPIED